MSEEKKGKLGKFLSIGCLGIVVLTLIGGFLAYRAVTGFVGEMIDEYTSTSRLEMPVVSLTEAENQDLDERVNRFQTALDSDQGTEPLVLSGDEVNQLLDNHPDFKDVAENFHLQFEENKASGLISMPLDLLGSLGEGRFLNGEAGFDLSFSNGNLEVNIDWLKVNNEPISEQFMAQLRGENLARDAQTNRELAKILGRLESISIVDGKVHIVPKSAPAPTEDSRSSTSSEESEAPVEKDSSEKAPAATAPVP